MKESLVALMLACIVGSGLAELTDKRAMTLLNRYGFSDGEPSTDSDIKRAVEDFQNFHRLEQTGELDKETKALLHMPRCGLPDVQADGNGRRTKRFVTTPYKWDKFHLTWGIANYASDFSENDQRTIFGEALKFWSDVSALTFEYTADPTSADIVISFFSGDHGDGYPFEGNDVTDVTDVAHAFVPFDLTNPIAGDVHFNDAINWAEYPNELLLVTLHELGHSLGLSHSQDISSLMYPFYDFNSLGPQPDDIAGIQALYGVKCGAPPVGVNTESVLIDEGSPGVVYNYTCISGYTADPLDLLVVCEQNNTETTASWSPGPPICTSEMTTPVTTAPTIEMTTPVTTAPTTEMTTPVTTAPTTEMITAPPPKNELVCKGVRSYIKCDEGLIHIVSAVWGRTDTEPACGKTSEERNCELDVIEYLAPLCENEPSCDFKPKGSLFGGSTENPCDGVKKYLNFTYTCEEEATTTMQPTTMQPTTTAMQPTTTTMQPTTTAMQPTVPPATTLPTVCQGTFGTINCGLNNVVICSAYYGRNNNNICPSGQANTASSCFEDVTDMQNLRCNDRTTCFVHARPSYNGLACPLHPQAYLEVTYTCAPEGCPVPALPAS